jgi:hypothetical protein
MESTRRKLGISLEILDRTAPSQHARTIADIGAETHALGLVDEAEASRN